VGGQLQQPLDEFIPMPDPNFEINAQTEMIMRAISSTMQLGANKDRMSWTRAIGLYGPPGTGKNTIARQVAASVKTVDAGGNLSQGMNYVEANITPESSMQELIGTTVLETDPASGSTVSRTRLGKIGLAAAMGSVVCVNEMVRNPKLATALQSMLEDGEIQIDSPEQGMIRIPVHPSTIFVMTWNPGYEGDPERPGQAPLSRMMPLRMDRASADEQARRVDSFFASVRGEKTEVDSISARRREILAKDYAIPKDITPTQEEIKTAVRFFGEVATLAGGGIGDRQIGLNSDSPTAPGQRQLNRYIALGKTVGWNDALETLKISCDQDDQYDNQWSLIRERFEAHFGTDGDVLHRTPPEQN
jgi:MoxR-like ATPase